MSDGKSDSEGMSRYDSGNLSHQEDGGCPDFETLAAYMDGCLGPQLREHVEEHLAGCEECRRFLVECAVSRMKSSESPIHLPLELRSGILHRLSGGEDDTIPHLVYRIATRLLELASGPGVLRVIEPAPVRGDAGETAQRLVLSGYEVDAAVDRRRDGKFEVWLKMTRETSSTQPCEWQIWRNDRLLEQQPAENGEVLFTNLEQGTYRCVLRLGRREAAAMKLTVEDDRE